MFFYAFPDSPCGPLLDCAPSTFLLHVVITSPHGIRNVLLSTTSAICFWIPLFFFVLLLHRVLPIDPFSHESEREEASNKVSPQGLNMSCDKIDQIAARTSDLSVCEWSWNSQTGLGFRVFWEREEGGEGL